MDELKHELTYEQWQEWLAFMLIEPQGWRATQMATTRLSYIVAQSQSRRTLKESDFRFKVQLPMTPQEQALRAEQEAIRVKAMIAQQELANRVRHHA